MPSARRSLTDMQIARLSLSGVNEKMRCAAHAVRGTFSLGEVRAEIKKWATKSA